MMNYIWAGIMLVSIICAVVTGRTGEVSDAIFSGGETAVMLCLSLLGTLCLWSGLMNIADKAGITRVLGRICRPLIVIIFPKLDVNSPAATAITMNIAANMLGLGNAATPLGLEAMRRLQKDNSQKDTLSNHMVTFIVLNTASIQILPTTIAAVRAEHGAVSPMDIVPALLLASITSMAVGLALVAILNLKSNRKNMCRGVVA